MKNLLKSKTVALFLLIFITVAFSAQHTKACEIEFEVTKNKKEVYAVGDIIVVKVKVILTHRSCPVAMKQTKFTMKGLKVVGTTEWLQLSTMIWERKLKMQVTGTKNGKLILNAVRTCDKDGGFGSMKLNSEPLK